MVAREILYQLSVDRAQARPTLGRISRAVFAGVGLGIATALALLVPFLVGMLLTAALFLVAIFLIASPLLAFVQDGPTTTYFLELPLLAGLFGLGLIVWTAAAKFASFFVRLMLDRLQHNVKLRTEDKA